MRFKKRKSLWWGICFGLSCVICAQAQGKKTPDTASFLKRTVMVLHNFTPPDERFRLAQILETPLNHLGLVVEYYNTDHGLPDIEKRQDVLGLITWYAEDRNVPNPQRYVRWLAHHLKQGRKIVIFEQPGFLSEDPQWKTQLMDVNALMKPLGIRFSGGIELMPQGSFLRRNKAWNLLEFERQYSEVLPLFEKAFSTDNQETALLNYQDGPTLYTLVSMTAQGAYVSAGYGLYSFETGKIGYRAWYLNPFEFFRQVFNLKDYPIPDTTTVTGNRLFYSHIDGDGWNNATELEPYRSSGSLCSEVLRDGILRAYPDIPVSIGVIEAEIDEEWSGQKNSAKIAKQIYALPHVETASHTLSHPFSWEFFEGTAHLEKEKAYFDYYPSGNTWGTNNTHKTLWEKVEFWVHKGLRKYFGIVKKPQETPEKLLIQGVYDVPRGFAHKPFNLKDEITGSCEHLASLAPVGKSPKLLLWSGNCNPPEEALRLLDEKGFHNLNGGDSRFDWEYYSYAWVAPKGKKVGPYWQIYTSMANETIYTRTWTERFYSYRDLVQTFLHTESPLRLSPMNLYYHTYITEKNASFQSLIHNLRFIRKQKITPVKASDYSQIVQGFYKVRFKGSPSQGWDIEDRGALQTLRFDQATLNTVDFKRSRGVLGQKHFQGSLYVFLDATVKVPHVVLKESLQCVGEAQAHRPYVIHSSWPLKNLLINGVQGFSFEAQGFGRGKMCWKAPEGGGFTYELSLWRGGIPLQKETVTVTPQGTLLFTLGAHGIQGVRVHLKSLGSGGETLEASKTSHDIHEESQEESQEERKNQNRAKDHHSTKDPESVKKGSHA